MSRILNLHVCGQEIDTTNEHPFWVEDGGWTEAKDLRIGDRLLSRTGQSIAIDGIVDSGRVEQVHNLEVENDHTYFVATLQPGLELWAHNYKSKNPIIGKRNGRSTLSGSGTTLAR